MQCYYICKICWEKILYVAWPVISSKQMVEHLEKHVKELIDNKATMRIDKPKQMFNSQEDISEMLQLFWINLTIIPYEWNDDPLWMYFSIKERPWSKIHINELDRTCWEFITFLHEHREKLQKIFTTKLPKTINFKNNKLKWSQQ